MDGGSDGGRGTEETTIMSERGIEERTGERASDEAIIGPPRFVTRCSMAAAAAFLIGIGRIPPAAAMANLMSSGMGKRREGGYYYIGCMTNGL